MDELVDYFVDPLEDVPIWTTPRITAAGYYTFESELSDEVDALPPFFRSRISSVTLPEDAPSHSDLISRPLSPHTLDFADTLTNPNEKTLEAVPVTNPPSSASGKPLANHPLVSAAQELILATPLRSKAPPLGNFTEIGPIPSFFASIPSAAAARTRASPSLSTAQLAEAPKITAAKFFGVSKKKRCLKLQNYEFFLKLTEDTQSLQSTKTAEKVLVGHVRDRHYSVEKLQQWTSEVWGNHLKDPPKVQTFVKGWFALQFKSLAHTNWVLSTVWHIDQALVLLKRGSMLDPYENAFQGYLYISGWRMCSSGLGMPLATTSHMIILFRVRGAWILPRYWCTWIYQMAFWSTLTYSGGMLQGSRYWIMRVSLLGADNVTRWVTCLKTFHLMTRVSKRIPQFRRSNLRIQSLQKGWPRRRRPQQARLRSHHRPL